MKTTGTLQSRESAAAQAHCQTNASNRILVVDDDVDIRPSSAEVFIRHVNNFLLKKPFINRKQHQAGNAASQCQLRTINCDPSPKPITMNKTFNARGLIIGLAVAVLFVRHDATAAQAPVSLGTAAKFAVLAATTVTSSGATTVNGHLGVSPGTAVTGSLRVSGMVHAGGPTAAQAQLDLTTTYNAAAGRTVGALTVAGNLGGLTLTPGLYKSTSSLEISSGDLTLDAQGDTNAVFIFQMASTLTTTSGRQVILTGGAKAANIYWQVGSSAALGTTSVFKGNILAATSITVAAGAAVEGRLLARTAAVTLDTNTITLPAP